MSKKEFIDEAVVSDRTSPMTNPMTKDSLRSARLYLVSIKRKDGSFFTLRVILSYERSL